MRKGPEMGTALVRCSRRFELSRVNIIWGFVPTHLKPVDCTAVDERREHAQTAAKGVTDWAHRQDHVQVGLHTLNEEIVHGQRCCVNLLTLPNTNSKTKRYA